MAPQFVAVPWQTQSPAAQVASAGATPAPAHARPQVPQSEGSRETSTHAPGAGPQVAGADPGQAHAPARHAAPVGHRCPQAPQLAASPAWTSTHRALQQIDPAAHTLPQAPQLEASVPAVTQRSPQRRSGLVHDSFEVGQPARSAAAPRARAAATPRARGRGRFTRAMMAHAPATVHRERGAAADPGAGRAPG